MRPERSSMRGRRFLSLFLPRWPADRLARRTPALRDAAGAAGAAGAAPLVLHEKEKGALRIYAGDARAAAAGLYPGQPLAEARALHPGLLAFPADPAGDAEDFRKIAEWLTRYAPFVGVPARRAPLAEAILDITGAAHLFGGEAALLDDLLVRLRSAGIEARAAIADSPGGAFAMAQAGDIRQRIIPTGGARAALAELPVGALRLEAGAAEGLRRLGLKRIGQLYALPRGPLAARLGAHALTRLAQALGEEDEPIAPLLPAPDFTAEARLLEPVVSAEAAMTCLERMAPALERKLERAGKGGRRFELALYRIDHHVTRIAVGASRPTRKPPHILRLFRDRLADIHDEREAGFGYDLMRLAAFDCDSYDEAPARFDAPLPGDDFGELKDRLANRLGAAQVCALSFANSHVPERSAAFAPILRDAPLRGAPQDEDFPCFNKNRLILRSGPQGRVSKDRPLKLLARPEPIAAIASVPDGPPSRFVWRRVAYAVKKAAGPERIAGEWWKGRQATRDYYRIEDADGRRWWVFRKGLYGKDAEPEWFLHGAFG